MSVSKLQMDVTERRGTNDQGHWSWGAKSGVGCALTAASHIWFTISRGILTEVYHPWVDHACIRAMALVLTNGRRCILDELSECLTDTGLIEPGVPAYAVTNQSADGHTRIEKQIIADPTRDVLLQQCEVSRESGLQGLHAFVILWPSLGDQFKDHRAWIGSYRGRQMLFAQHQGHALTLAASCPWARLTVGAATGNGPLDDLRRRGELGRIQDHIDHDDVVLVGQIDLDRCEGKFELAIGVDRSPQAAAVNALMSLHTPFDELRERYATEWRNWHGSLHRGGLTDVPSSATAAQQRQRPDHSRPRTLKSEAKPADLCSTAMTVLQVHRSKQFAGAGVASLSTPWGEARGEDNLGGYHLAWPRDLVESAIGMLAGGAHDAVRQSLHYLRATQSVSGGWPQDMWLDGTEYGHGTQLDEAALPVLLLDLAERKSAIDPQEIAGFWPMVQAAARFIVRRGPSTGQDRWENTPGLSPYTLATEIAALLVAAKTAERFGEQELASCFRQAADVRNDSIEQWTYVTGTPLARKVGVAGYYIRISPSPGIQTLMRRGQDPTIAQSHHLRASEIVSPDALALVRFGIRAADDPRILNTIRVLDSVTRFTTPAGPCWHRYNGDYYGELADGSPPRAGQIRRGHGRGWPLLVGERGHYELAAGNHRGAEIMLETMGAFASQAGLIPEQIWDTNDIPARQLFLGRASGSAMPLAWAEAEYVALLRSLRDGKIFDMPVDAFQRYVVRKTSADAALWRFDHQTDVLPRGRRLKLETESPAIVRFSLDRWRSVQELHSTENQLGIQAVEVPSEKMSVGDAVNFTFRWPQANNKWEGKDFQVTVVDDQTD